jgi:hypothetical protein
MDLFDRTVLFFKSIVKLCQEFTKDIFFDQERKELNRRPLVVAQHITIESNVGQFLMKFCYLLCCPVFVGSRNRLKIRYLCDFNKEHLLEIICRLAINNRDLLSLKLGNRDCKAFKILSEAGILWKWIFGISRSPSERLFESTKNA